MQMDQLEGSILLLCGVLPPLVGAACHCAERFQRLGLYRLDDN